LYLDNKGESEPRVTKDVDCVVELSYKDLIDFENSLRKLGFYQPKEDLFICRWKYKSVLLDIMPTKATVFGFSNSWHEVGFKNSIKYKLNDKYEIKIFPASVFIASKFEAFKDRGENDYRTSQDIEDIITILNGRKKYMRK
jgi:hypothetical protein